jgi:hypothetical protein
MRTIAALPGMTIELCNDLLGQDNKSQLGEKLCVQGCSNRVLSLVSTRAVRRQLSLFVSWFVFVRARATHTACFLYRRYFDYKTILS